MAKFMTVTSTNMRLTKKFITNTFDPHLTVFIIFLLTSSLTLALEINNESTTGTVRVTGTVAQNADNSNMGKTYQPSLIRTQLKVSRSLDPEKTESINVRSNLGGYATIIVKKRNGNQRGYFPESNMSARQNEQQLDGQSTSRPMTKLHLVSPEGGSPADYNRWNAASNSIRFAEPTNQQSVNVINSFIKHIENIERTNNDSLKNDRKPVHISLAQPKVYDQFVKLPSPTVVRSDTVYVKDTPNYGSKAKRSRSLMQIGTDGIPVIEGIRVPDDEEDKKKVWRNARVIKGELVPYEKGYVPPKVQIEKANLPFGQVIFVRDAEDRTRRARHSDASMDRSFGPFTKQDNFKKEAEGGKSFGPFTVEDNREKRDYNPYAQLNEGPYFVKDNSKIAGSRLIDYIKQINDQHARRDYFIGRSSPEDFLREPQQIQRRMLNNIKDYSDEQTNEIADNLRQPVSVYAHPDLGIQPARPPPTSESRNKVQKESSKKIQYYVQDTTVKQNKNNFYDSALNSQEYFRPPYYDTYEYKKPSTYPYNYGYLKKVKDQPLWMKLTEQMRDTFQTGITSVEAMARPVFQPIVEAGQKISKNLGFTQSQPAQYAQDKVGIVSGPGLVAGSAPALLPALGLMAGGAALGMAVGRLFEGNLLKRSENSLTPEHKRNLNEFLKNRGMYVLVEETEENNPVVDKSNFQIVDVVVPEASNQQQQHKLYKRSLNSNEDFGELLQNVEEDVAKTKSIGFEERIRQTNWKNTGCAKQMFCQVMLEQNSDENVLMEKKMENLLSTLEPNLKNRMSNHLTEVTDAIQKRDCSVFICVKN